MSWLIAGTAGVGLVKGVADGRANRKQQKKHDAHRKAQIMYSPWTGLGDPGAVNAGPTGLGSALGGAMSGAMLGGQLSKMGGMFGGAQKPIGNMAMADPSALKPKGSAGSMGGSTWDMMGSSGPSMYA